jgi:hypothetical protein
MYKKLGKTSLLDLTRILIESAPALFAEFESCPRNRDGTVTLSQSLAQRIDYVLVQDSVKSHFAKLREEDDKIHKEAHRRLKIERLHKEGLDRLECYAREQGLERTEANAKAVDEWINRVYHIWQPNAVDAAIKALRDRLTWVKAETPQSEPQELLPNGEPRLALGTTPSRKHSIEQLRDLDQRQRGR